MPELLPIIFVLLPALASAGAAVDFGKPVDCRGAKFTPETTICDHEDLRVADASIANTYSKLATVYRGEDLKIFAAGQVSWMTERNDCRNSPTASRYQGGLYGCLKAKLADRVAVLDGLLRDPAGLGRTVAAYTFVEVWYVLKFARRFEGKDVSVGGDVVLKDCNSVAPRSTIGRLRNEGTEIEIRFSTMDDATRSFLCAKNPFSWWRATVRMVDGHPSLYAIEVLGRAL